MTSYPNEERARARHAVNRLNTLAGEAKRAAEQGLILPDITEQGIYQLTQTSERSRQVDALTALAGELQKRHLDKLLPLAKDEFNAFCEYVSPDEPPSSRWHVWLTEKLQQIEFDPALDRFILNCPPGHAKPLHVDTLVLMSDGTYKRLGDIYVGDRVVSGAGKVRRVDKVHRQGELALLRITSRRGRTVLAAPDHPFLVDGERWVQASELKPGDRLSIVGAGDKFKDRSGQDAAMFELAAYYAAFGGFSLDKDGRRQFRLWFVDRGHMERVAKLCDQLGLRYGLNWVQANGRHLLRLHSKNADALEHILRLRDKVTERRVPEWVFQGDADKVRLYLSTLLKLRGVTPKRASQASLHLNVQSEALARDLQRLFARFQVDAGIVLRAEDEPGLIKLRIEAAGCEQLLAQQINFIGWGTPEFAKRRAPGPLPIADEVAFVEAAGHGECRCLEVAHDHSFTADGMVVHNSTYASRLFVGWRLGRNPTIKIIGGGHSQRFVENEFSAKIRNLVASPEYRRVFPNVVVDYATRAKDQWAIAGSGGSYVAKGVGQAVHGFRANFACIDDPYAKIEEAESAVQREKVNTWFVGDIGSRMLPFGKMFLIMTRFHEEDLTGYLMAMNDKLPAYARWHQVEAPALCIDPETDVLGRKLGEVLWDYYDLSYFVAKKTEWTFQRFSLVYQQNASATSDSTVAGKFKTYHHAPHQTPEAVRKARDEGQLDDAGRPKPDIRDYFRRIVLSVDCAAKVNERADYTVVQTWGETLDKKHYLLRQTRVKVEFDQMIEVIEKQARKDGVDVILVEDKGQGTAYIQNRGLTAQHRRLAPAPVIGIDPKGQSKEFRFDEVSPMIVAGEVYIPEKADWIDGFIKEFGQFPEGAHDDQVDAATQYLRWVKTAKTRRGSRKIGSFG